MDTIVKLSLQLETQLLVCKEDLRKAASEIESLQQQLSETSENDKKRSSELLTQLEAQKRVYETQSAELTRLLQLQEQFEKSLKQAQIERDLWCGGAIIFGTAAIVELIILIFKS